jgi:hypothetical protein
MKTNTIKYRNKFESDTADKLTKEWKYEPYHIPYIIKRRYIPDFVRGNVLIECKGYFRVGDTQKYKAIRDSLVTQELIFILYNHKKKIRKGAKMTMSEWCEKEGFKWFTLETMKELKRYASTAE